MKNTLLIIIIAILFAIALSYYFFYSDMAKKKELFMKIIEKHRLDPGFDASLEGLIKHYKGKSYNEILNEIKAQFPLDQF